jgi:hypothetical protein
MPMRLEIFQFHFFTSTATYQSSEKKMILHQTSERKLKSSALTFIKLTFMKIMQLQSYLQTLNPETPLASAVPGPSGPSLCTA